MTYHEGKRELTDGEVAAVAPVRAVEELAPEYTDAEIGAVVRMVKDGMEAWEITEDTGLNAQEISGICKKYGVGVVVVIPKAKPRPRRKVTDEQVREMVELWNAGATIPALAKRYGLSDSGVQWVLRPYKDEIGQRAARVPWQETIPEDHRRDQDEVVEELTGESTLLDTNR